MKSMTEVFEKIYQTKAWVKSYSDPTSLSGPGSFSGYAGEYHIFLKEFLMRNNIKSVVDYGCGDLMLYEGFNWKKIEYTGIDVSKTAIDIATERHPNKKFICQESLEVPAADLLIVKDVFGHWTGEKHTTGIGNQTGLILEFLKLNYNKFPYILIVDGKHATFEEFFLEDMKFNTTIVPFGKKAPKKIYIKEVI